MKHLIVSAQPSDDRRYPDYSGPASFIDDDFDDMLQFGLHDEHQVRSIMDLPPHAFEVRRAS